MEVAIPSEAAKIAIKGNIHFMHIYISVIYASDFKFEAKFAIRDNQFITIARESIGPLPSC